MGIKNVFILFFIGLFFSFSLGLGLQHHSFAAAPRQTESDLAVRPLDPKRDIEIGMHIENIYNLSLKDKTFNAEGWFWLKWPEAVQEIITKNKIPILEIVELVNQVETWDSNIQLDSNEPELQADGNRLQLVRFSAKFYDDAQNLKRFPFETLELPITVETRPTIFSMADQAISLYPKLGTTGVLGQYAGLNGFELQGSSLTKSIYAYSTNFGESNGEKGGEFSRVDYTVNYATEFWPSFYQYIMPWLAVMAMLILAPNLEGKFTELRLAIPSTALLTLVFLQLGTSSDLPKLSYITFIDQLYLFGYIASIVLFALFVWGSNLYETAPAEQQQTVMLKINRIDLIYQISVIAGSGLIAVSASL